MRFVEFRRAGARRSLSTRAHNWPSADHAFLIVDVSWSTANDNGIVVPTNFDAPKSSDKFVIVDVTCEPPAVVHSRAFGDGLFELRPRGRAGIGRALYCFMAGKRVTVLHAFIKKTRQTPDRELRVARKRLKELQDG